MHDSEPELVHFHEVGGLDALADVCGVALALEELAIDRVECSPIPCSRGFADASHGRLPLPAPATLELLRGAPLVPLDIGIELVTPTAAAIFAATVERYGAMPAMTLENVGYGAGTRDLPQVPNIVRVLVGELTETASPAFGGDVIVIETNLDDTPGRARARCRRARLRGGRARRLDDARADEEGPARRGAGRARAPGRRARGGRGDRARDDRARRAHVAPRAARAGAALPRRHGRRPPRARQARPARRRGRQPRARARRLRARRRGARPAGQERLGAAALAAAEAGA